MDLTFEDLDLRLEAVLRNGPDHCVICAAGRAVAADVALKRYGVKPDVIYVRADGWTLGAERRYARVAEQSWRALWVAEVDVASKEAKEYRYRTA